MCEVVETTSKTAQQNAGKKSDLSPPGHFSRFCWMIPWHMKINSQSLSNTLNDGGQARVPHVVTVYLSSLVLILISH